MKIKLDDTYWTKIMDMWNYLAYSIHPNGTTELNNDSNVYNLRELLKKKAEKFNRPDWLFIATSGIMGTDPSNFIKSAESSSQLLLKQIHYSTNSYVFPYAGHVILRNSFEPTAEYLFFDIGPSGISPTYLHFDKLHISLSIGKEDFLVDSGAYRHVRDRWRLQYFKHTRGHNTISIEDKSQNRAGSLNTKSLSQNLQIFNGYELA